VTLSRRRAGRPGGHSAAQRSWEPAAHACPEIHTVRGLKQVALYRSFLEKWFHVDEI